MDGRLDGWMVVIKHNKRPVKCVIIHRRRAELLPDFFFPTGSLWKRRDSVKQRLNWCLWILRLNTYKKPTEWFEGCPGEFGALGKLNRPFLFTVQHDNRNIYEVGSSKDLTFFCLKHYWYPQTFSPKSFFCPTVQYITFPFRALHSKERSCAACCHLLGRTVQHILNPHFYCRSCVQCSRTKTGKKQTKRSLHLRSSRWLVFSEDCFWRVPRVTPEAEVQGEPTWEAWDREATADWWQLHVLNRSNRQKCRREAVDLTCVELVYSRRVHGFIALGVWF